MAKTQTDSLYEFVMRHLDAHPARDWPEIAEGADVSIHSLRKIARRIWQNPGVQSMDKLAAYFRSQPVSA